MRLVFSNLLLLIALGACFKATDAQEPTTQTDANITITIPNSNTGGSILSFEVTSATPENTAVARPTVVDPRNSETTVVNQISTMPEEQTVASTPPLSTVIEQTTPESVPETTTVQTEQTTVTTTTVPVIAETTVTEQIPSDAPSTSQHETTVGFTSPEVTSPTEQPTDEITTAVVTLATASTKAINPTTIVAKPDSDESPTITSNPVDTNTELSTTTLASTTKHPQNSSEVYTMPDGSLASVTIEDNGGPFQNTWLIIMIVCVVIVFVLCVGMIVIIRRRKKNASRNFTPVNGQGKRSKKKKGAENDAWAGPVNLDAGAECDAEAQDGLLPNDGKQDDDVVLSTFAALDAEDASNGGVGGDGTKEAKKWEEQEPMPYIDEDVKENKAEKTPSENGKQKGDDKSEEKGMNGGETFCLTTAV